MMGKMPVAVRSPPADMVWLCHDLGSCAWTVDHASWVVAMHSPQEQDFSGKTLEEALAWCLVWLTAPEIGVGPFRV
jgi:hypothetical protein